MVVVKHGVGLIESASKSFPRVGDVCLHTHVCMPMGAVMKMRRSQLLP